MKTPPGAHPELGQYRLDDIHVAFDTRVEVIDSVGGRVLATVPVDEALFGLGFLGGRAVSRREDEDGAITLRLWHMRLRNLTNSNGDGGTRCVGVEKSTMKRGAAEEGRACRSGGCTYITKRAS